MKYLPYAFVGRCPFYFPPINVGIPYAYGKAMDGMDKLSNMHAWCRTKTKNTQNEFNLIFWGLHVLVISKAQKTCVSIFCEMVEIATAPNGLVLHQLLLWLVKTCLRNLSLNARFVVPLPYVLQFVMQELNVFIPNHQACPKFVFIWMLTTITCLLECVVSN